MDRPYPEARRVKVYTLPAVETMACTVHHGDYESLTQAYEALVRRVEANGYRVAGLNRHLYYRTPGDVDGNWADMITEVQYPVTKG